MLQAPSLGDSNSVAFTPLRKAPAAAAPAIAASAALKADYLAQISKWAADVAPPIGALLGSRLAATCGAPHFSCSNCGIALELEVNCSLVVTKRPNAKRKVYTCNYCRARTVLPPVKGTPKKKKKKSVVVVVPPSVQAQPSTPSSANTSTSKKRKRKWSGLKELSASKRTAFEMSSDGVVHPTGGEKATTNGGDKGMHHQLDAGERATTYVTEPNFKLTALRAMDATTDVADADGEHVSTDVSNSRDVTEVDRVPAASDDPKEDFEGNGNHGNDSVADGTNDREAERRGYVEEGDVVMQVGSASCQIVQEQECRRVLAENIEIVTFSRTAEKNSESEEGPRKEAEEAEVVSMMEEDGGEQKPDKETETVVGQDVEPEKVSNGQPAEMNGNSEPKTIEAFETYASDEPEVSDTKNVTEELNKDTEKGTEEATMDTEDAFKDTEETPEVVDQPVQMVRETEHAAQDPENTENTQEAIEVAAQDKKTAEENSAIRPEMLMLTAGGENDDVNVSDERMVDAIPEDNDNMPEEDGGKPPEQEMVTEKEIVNVVENDVAMTEAEAPPDGNERSVAEEVLAAFPGAKIVGDYIYIDGDPVPAPTPVACEANRAEAGPSEPRLSEKSGPEENPNTGNADTEVPPKDPNRLKGAVRSFLHARRVQSARHGVNLGVAKRRFKKIGKSEEKSRSEDLALKLYHSSKNFLRSKRVAIAAARAQMAKLRREADAVPDLRRRITEVAIEMLSVKKELKKVVTAIDNARHTWVKQACAQKQMADGAGPSTRLPQGPSTSSRAPVAYEAPVLPESATPIATPSAFGAPNDVAGPSEVRDPREETMGGFEKVRAGGGPLRISTRSRTIKKRTPFKLGLLAKIGRHWKIGDASFS